MAQSDARFGYRASLSRDTFDLSKPFGFTCCPGMLCPVFSDFASPGDYYEIKHDLNFLRTAPLAAPAMIDVKVHYESFFVPFQMIYQASENVMFSLKNLQSSNFNQANLQNVKLPLLGFASYVGTLTGNSTYIPSATRQLAFRFMDFFELHPLSLCVAHGPVNSANGMPGFTPSFFPWQAYVYNTIFYYYYRLDDKSSFDNALCNCDRYYSVTSFYAPQANFFTIYSRPWDFDYFNSLYWSPIVSDANMQPVLGGSGQFSDLVNSITSGVKNDETTTNQNALINAFGSRDSQGQAASKDENTASIRQLFANEKLAMITGRTKKNYDSQVLAHYGVKVPVDIKHDLQLIGRDTFDLRIGEVTSLASTEAAPLGELAGKGFAFGNGKTHKFKAPCHGFVMTIFSVEPKRRYYGGFNRNNAIVDAFDFPVPEFDRLGNVPMYRYESGRANVLGQNATDVIGWKERYYWNKRKAPRCSMAFMEPQRIIVGGSSYPFVNPYHAYMLGTYPYSQHGQPTTRPDMESQYYIQFNCLDGLMLQPYFFDWKISMESEGDEPGEDWSRTPYQLYMRDPFIVDSYEKVKKVSWMSKDGEPIYNF